MHVEIDELLRTLDWDRPENDGVDEAKDGRVGADADCQRQDGGRGKSGPSGKRAQTVPRIADDSFRRQHCH